MSSCATGYGDAFDILIHGKLIALVDKSAVRFTCSKFLCLALAVGGYAFGAGTYASIVSINRASGELGGPFACDCMARQCVK